MQVDRRRAEHDRRNVGRVSAVFAVKSTVGKRIDLCQAEDLAPHGITLRRPAGVVLRLSTPVSLNFELPGSDEAIVAGGLVVSDTDHGHFRRTGVRFTHIHPQHQAAVAAFCDRMLGGALAGATAGV